MTNTADESHTDSFQDLDLVKKKKKKKRRLDAETHGQSASAGFCSPLSLEQFPIFSWDFDDKASEGNETSQKKSKKKARQEKSDSWLDYPCITTESELTSKSEVEVCKPKKKKKRKLSPNEPDDGHWLSVPLSQGKTSSQPKANGLGNGDWTDRGSPVKKKRARGFVAKQNEASKVSAGPMENRTDPTSSDRYEEASHSSAEDSQVELFTSTPCEMQHSSIFQKKAATKVATSTEVGSPVTPRKPHKHKKSFGVKESDSTEVTQRKPHKHKESSGVEDSDSTGITPRKPHKHTKSSGVEESDSTDVIPRTPHKHKESSDMEESDNTNVIPRRPHKHKESSGVEDFDSTSVTQRKPHKRKKSCGVEESNCTDATQRKSHKHKKSSGVEESNSTDLIPRRPHKRKESCGVEESVGTDVIPRKPHKHKESSVEECASTDVIPRKSQKHKKSSGVEESNSTSIIPRRPHKHKESCGVEDSDNTGVIQRKPHKHKNSSRVEESDSTKLTQRKPHKHKESSVEESASTDVIPRKSRKHKKSSGVEESDSTEVTQRKPHKHKKSCVEELDSTDVTPKRLHKHKESSGVEDSDSAGITPRKPHKHKKSSGVRLPKISKDLGNLSSKELPTSESFFAEENEFMDFSELVIPDLDKATQMLEEFIPHVRKLSPLAIKQLSIRDLIRFKNFKQKGIAVKFGKFTQKENNQLRKNVEAFLEESGIENAEKLLFTHRFPEERIAINKLKAKHLFGIRIAEGIPRPWRLVYYRARKIFDPGNYNGRYSSKEKRKLLKYQAMYGNDWKKISLLMSRSSHSIALKYSQIKCAPNTGPWSKEETKRLIQAVEEVLQAKCKESGSTPEEEDLSVSREDLYKGISWMKVEAKVGTRHWRQCKHKWLCIVTKKMSHGQLMARGYQNLQFRINLIEKLYELNVEDANEIDWEVLSTVIGDVPPDYIQWRFYRLKATCVPYWHEKTFPEIIDHLYEVTLPKLKALLEKKKTKAQSIQVKEQRKVFRFQEIFQNSSDELVEDDSEDEPEAEGGVDGSDTGRKEEQS